MDKTKHTTPVIHVRVRLPRHAAMKNLPHRCRTMKKKNSSTLHRWMLLKKSPVFDTCHHDGPLRMSTVPEARMTTNAAMVRTPKVYTHEAT